jgi:hypothetical protein
MRIAHLFVVPTALLLATACADGQLPSESELDRLRILAARATPAEVSPGEAVQLESLTYSPGSGAVGVVWELCTGMECPTPERRTDPVAVLDDGSIDPTSGIVGLEPESPPAFVAPPGILDALPDEAREEGAFVRFGLSAVSWPGGDPDEVEWATKDLPISTSTAPNANPSITTVRIDGTAFAPGETVVVDGREVELEVVGLDDMAESYAFRTTDGALETREETLDVRWYTDVGSLDGTRWNPDAADPSGVLIAVVRDGRGGTDWAVFDVEVE